MKKLLVLALVLLLIPSAFAVVAQMQQPALQTTLIKPGYEFARLQGVNNRDTPISVVHWHLNAEAGLVHAFCELQPTTLPPGPFTADIVVQCQTRSGMTSFLPMNTKAKVDSFTQDDVPAGSFSLEKVWIETRPESPTPFPVTPIAGEAISDEQASGGSALFLAGIGAIILLAITVILSSLRKEE